MAGHTVMAVKFGTSCKCVLEERVGSVDGKGRIFSHAVAYFNHQQPCMVADKLQQIWYALHALSPTAACSIVELTLKPAPAGV
jgi:hypothetical protein